MKRKMENSRICILLLIAIMCPGLQAQPLTETEKEMINESVVSMVKNMVGEILEIGKEGLASLHAWNNAVETLRRQRIAGLPLRADTVAIETSLRLLMRANADRLQLKNNWRQYPDNAAYAAEAKRIAKVLEKSLSGTWRLNTKRCGSNDIMKTSLNRLLFSAGGQRLAAKPAPPPYTEAERAYRFGPVPKMAMPMPTRDEKSALWLHWAATTQSNDLITKMIEARSSAESAKGPLPRLSPDRAQVREAIKFWALAAATENGSQLPEIPGERIDAATTSATRAIGDKYGYATTAQLMDCRFGEFVLDKISAAAKSLSIVPVSQ